MGQTIDVIWVSVRAILQVFICVSVGALLSRAGFLTKETLQNLGKLSYYVFIPALSFYKICAGVRLSQLVDAWPFLIYPSLIASIGFLVGAGVARILRIESKALRHSIVVTIMFGNYGNLPFSLLETITKDVEPFRSDPAAMQRALAYCSIFLSTASLWLWSFGPWYIKTARSIDVDIESEKEDDSKQVELAPIENRNEFDSDVQSPAQEHLIESNENQDSSYMEENETKVVASYLDDYAGNSNSCRFNIHTLKNALLWIASSKIWGLITPSTLACIAAVIVLAIGPLHRSMFIPPPLPVQFNSSSPMAVPQASEASNMIKNIADSTAYSAVDSTASPTSTVPQKPPLQFIADSINGLGNVCIPISLLMLGANLYTTVRTQIERSRIQTNTGESVLPLKKKVLAGVVLTKLILIPTIFFVITYLIYKTGIFPNDPLIAIILIIEGCMPTAINLIILAQLQDDQQVVEQLSTIMLGQYIFCTISIFITIAVGIKVFL